MNTSSRIIHISDIHCTTRNYLVNFNLGGTIANVVTLLPVDNPTRGAYQDTPAKCGEIVNFLIGNVQILGTNRIVVTGDLVDSAEEDGFDNYAKQYFLDPLTSHGFDVTVVPGNHDYFCLGNQFTTIRIADGARHFFNAFSSFMKTNGPTQYPVDLDLGGGNHLILINSLKGHYDVRTNSHMAQGNIGQQQMDWLSTMLPQYQEARAAGSKIAMAMHHSPFETSSTLELTDAKDFLDVIANRIDALMFGHTHDRHEFFLDEAGRLGIPLINCENIDKMSRNGYPISVIDLTFNQVEVYSTKLGSVDYYGVRDTRVPVALQWFATLPS